MSRNSSQETILKQYGVLFDTQIPKEFYDTFHAHTTLSAHYITNNGVIVSHLTILSKCHVGMANYNN